MSKVICIETSKGSLTYMALTYNLVCIASILSWDQLTEQACNSLQERRPWRPGLWVTNGECLEWIWDYFENVWTIADCGILSPRVKVNAQCDKMITRCWWCIAIDKLTNARKGVQYRFWTWPILVDTHVVGHGGRPQVWSQRSIRDFHSCTSLRLVASPNCHCVLDQEWCTLFVFDSCRYRSAWRQRSRLHNFNFISLLELAKFYQAHFVIHGVLYSFDPRKCKGYIFVSTPGNAVMETFKGLWSQLQWD